jgi:hypothetical protein
LNSPAAAALGAWWRSTLAHAVGDPDVLERVSFIEWSTPRAPTKPSTRLGL